VAGLRLVLVLGQLLLGTITITTTRVGYWFGGTWRRAGEVEEEEGREEGKKSGISSRGGWTG